MQRALTLALATTTSQAWALSAAMRSAPSAERNKEPIAATLKKYRPFGQPDEVAGDAGTLQPCTCLEIASGTGQHVAHLASKFPHVTFQPTEFGGGSSGPEEAAYGDLAPVFASIRAWTDGLPNVRDPMPLDATEAVWPCEEAGTSFDALLASNLCHISPISVTEGLLAGASRLLTSRGRLFIYGESDRSRHTATETSHPTTQRLS
jgi:SAM-dependent methyltransferase